VQVLDVIKAQSHLDAGASFDFIKRSLGADVSEAELKCVVLLSLSLSLLLLLC
jgi:hypothetical protein